MKEIQVVTDDGRAFCVSVRNNEIEVQEHSPDDGAFYYYDPDSRDLRWGIEVLFDHLGQE